jgi:hypothetical protein
VRAFGAETVPETLDLASGGTESQSGLIGSQTALQECFAGFRALDLVQGEFPLRVVRVRPRGDEEASRDVSGVTFSPWHDTKNNPG